MLGGSNKPRRVKLLSPSVSKIVHYLAWDHHKLDLGSIAALFGLDPSTLKINGHFISRGVDLISPSVTWSSLLSFFSSKGFSTDKDALIVDGKLCKAGTKRNEPQNASGRCWKEPDGVDVSSRQLQQTEDVDLKSNKKLKESNSGCGFKRKQLMEGVNLLKKLKINDSCSDSGVRGSNQLRIVSGGQFKCAYISGNAKRMREDEAILAAPCKRSR